MTVLISAVLPIALVALAGVCVGRSFDLDLRTLARLNIYALLPALVLTSLAETTLGLRSAIALVAAFLLNTALLYLLARGLGRSLKFSPDEQKSLIATTLFANVGNMGLPFVLFSLGEAGLERAVVYLVGSSLMVASVFPIVLKGTGIRAGVRFTVQLPVFWAALLGLGLQIGNEALPEAINRGVTLLSGGAIPIALLTLGIQLSQTQFAFGPYELFGSGLRLIVSPLMAYSIGRVLGLEGLDLQVLVLQAAMPVAVNSLIWVTELGGDTVRVARTIVLSTFLSFLTLPGVLWLSAL
ncbi:MAG: AEC family transporter [Leptolyngbya sp. SIO4C5]|uniref:AEC family transporter n=1 Tax=Sphaerothrix gracilis TaxID=3151835 RepID=UPI0013BEC693|nr:AEC family transporter [Leptolyngbya sp. SIO4C5]